MFEYTYEVKKAQPSIPTINPETEAIFSAYIDSGKILDHGQACELQEDGLYLCTGTIQFSNEEEFNNYKHELSLLESVYDELVSVVRQ